VIVDCAIYDDGRRRAGEFSFAEAFAASSAPGAFVWLGLYEPTGEEFASVREAFHLHELAVEDAIKAHQRPKLEIYDDTAFVVLKTARYVDREEAVQLGEILLFVGENFVIAVRHGEASALAEVRRGIERKPELLKCGPGAVLWAIVDHVVDDYLPVLAGLEHDIDEVETEVFSEARTNPAERIYFLKREVLEFLRGVHPLLDPLERLARGRDEIVHEDIRPYFRDVHDHLLRVVEQLESTRDLLTSVLQANFAQISVRESEDMRRISAWAAIIAVPTMIAGIYGMNFEHMPEIRMRYGYFVVLGAMALVCLGLYRAFRRSGWL
jgi:magnesium transporter